MSDRLTPDEIWDAIDDGTEMVLAHPSDIALVHQAIRQSNRPWVRAHISVAAPSGSPNYVGRRSGA